MAAFRHPRGALVPRRCVRTAPERETISVTREIVDSLARTREELSGVPVTARERPALVAAYVSDEILLREAYARDLHRQDGVVRKRLLELMRFLLVEEPAEPTRTELDEYLAAHRQVYLAPSSVTLSHVYLASERPQGPPEAERLLARLRAGVDFRSLGDPFWLGHRLEATASRSSNNCSDANTPGRCWPCRWPNGRARSPRRAGSISFASTRINRGSCPRQPSWTRCCGSIGSPQSAKSSSRRRWTRCGASIKSRSRQAWIVDRHASNALAPLSPGSRRLAPDRLCAGPGARARRGSRPSARGRSRAVCPRGPAATDPGVHVSDADASRAVSCVRPFRASRRGRPGSTCGWMLGQLVSRAKDVLGSTSYNKIFIRFSLS